MCTHTVLWWFPPPLQLNIRNLYLVAAHAVGIWTAFCTSPQPAPRTFDIRRRRRHVVSHIRCAFRRLTGGYFANLMPFAAAAAAEMKAREPHANIFFFIIHSPLEWFSLIKESRLFHWPKGTLIFSFLVSKEEWGGGVVWDCWLEEFSHIFWRAEVARLPDGKRFTQKGIK